MHVDDRIYSVNEVIGALQQFHGRTICIRCALTLEFEGDSIWHLPKQERRAGVGSSLWASFAYDALGFGREDLKQFVGRHVVVTAKIDCDFQGHFNLWPASVIVIGITKHDRKDSEARR